MRALVLATALALTLFVAAPASASWTAARTVTSDDYASPVAIAFNSRGDALLTGGFGFEGKGYTAIRPVRGRVGPIREFETDATDFGAAAVLDPDRGGYLIGTYLDYAPEFEVGIRDECCYRVLEARIKPSGRLRTGRKFSRHGEQVFGVGVETDDRGGAGAVWQADGGLFYTTRRRGRQFAAPRPMDFPPGWSYGQVAVRPSGWAFASWIDYAGGRVFAAQRPPGGTFSAPRTLYERPAGRQDSLVERGLFVGRNGHVWVTWQLGYDNGLLMAAARRADGSFGEPVPVGTGDFWSLETAVDDRGDLHLAWEAEPKGLLARSISRTRGRGPLTRLATRSVGDFAISAGPRGRAVVAWQTVRTLFAAHRVGGGRFTRVTRLDAGGGYVNLATSRQDETIATWVAGGRPDRVRYAVLRP